MRYPTAPVSIGIGLAISLLLATIVAFPAGTAQSREPNKTLKLFFGHTGEKGEFTFKRNGAYDRRELARINHFLRDWRKGEDARMDPHLLDLVWAIYQETGSRDYIHIVSAYRSPATNEMLRRRSSGVAKNSQHRLGKAMDWYLTDVPLAKLRAAAMKMQGGGVGYYPRSGSPFVHTDTGNVRAWPRMSRQQLLALFPNGNTLHLPADGKPLPGYEQAVARRHSAGSTALAYLETEPSEAEETDRTGTTDTSSNGWLRRVFPGEGEDSNVASTAPAPTPAAATADPQILTAALEEDDMPRAPRARPGSAEEAENDAAGPDAAIIVASADAQAVAAAFEPALPRTRPEAVAGTTAVSEEDAIASLAARMSQESPISTSDAADPIALAFAAASEASQPSAADRAILAAFAAVDASGDGNATLTAALTLRATDVSSLPQQEQQPPVLNLARAGADPLPVAADEPASVEPAIVEAAEPGTGFVIAAAEAASYDADEPSLLNLIETPARADPSAGQFEMPTPASELLVAPEAASEVADLRGQSGPPTERFAPSDGSPAERGFFSRLFASLIE